MMRMPATTIERPTSLHRSAFWVLRASSRDGRQRIVQLADEKSLEMDPDECQKARGQLTNTRTRLAAEMSWLPGVSPRKAEQLVARVAEMPGIVESGVAPLARLNLLVAGLEAHCGDHREVAAAILQIASELDDLVASDIRLDINEDRLASGFPQVASDDPIETELANRQRQIRDVVKETLNRLPTERLVSLFTELVESSTGGGQQHAPALIDELVDTYQVEAHEFLTKEAANLSRLVEAVRNAADGDRASTNDLVACIERVARNWDTVAQPIQVSARARGLRHAESSAIAFEIRRLAVDLCKHHDMIDESKRLIDMLLEVFAEAPQIVENVKKDLAALTRLQQDRQRHVQAPSHQARLHSAPPPTAEGRPRSSDKARHDEAPATARIPTEPEIQRMSEIIDTYPQGMSFEEGVRKFAAQFGERFAQKLHPAFEAAWRGKRWRPAPAGRHSNRYS